MNDMYDFIKNKFNIIIKYYSKNILYFQTIIQ